MKLLLIEDNIAMQTSVRRSFERRGMLAMSCDDGQRVLALWQSSLPDALLRDLSLPGRDGLEAHSDARAAGLRTPLINLTVGGTVGDCILRLHAGADDYLPKPFGLDELEARVRALVRRSTGNADTAAPRPPGAARTSTRTTRWSTTRANRWNSRPAKPPFCAPCWVSRDMPWPKSGCLRWSFQVKTGCNRRLSVVLLCDAQTAALTVSDSGPGISATLRKRLLQPFATETDPGSASTGSGLGLAICQGIVHSLGGSIDLVNREQQDRVTGLDATVRLPLAPRLPDPEPIASQTFTP